MNIWNWVDVHEKRKLNTRVCKRRFFVCTAARLGLIRWRNTTHLIWTWNLKKKSAGKCRGYIAYTLCLVKQWWSRMIHCQEANSAMTECATMNYWKFNTMNDWRKTNWMAPPQNTTVCYPTRMLRLKPFGCISWFQRPCLLPTPSNGEPYSWGK